MRKLACARSFHRELTTLVACFPGSPLFAWIFFRISRSGIFTMVCAVWLCQPTTCMQLVFANCLIICRVIWTQEFYGVSLLMPTANGARSPFINTVQTDCRLTLESCRFMRLWMLNAQLTFRRISKRGRRLAYIKFKLPLDSRVLWGPVVAESKSFGCRYSSGCPKL